MSFYRPGGGGTGDVTTTPLSVNQGGTGAVNKEDARVNLGVSATGADTTYAFRSNNLSDLTNTTTARTNLGLGTLATQNAGSVNISGGTIIGITDIDITDGGTGASSAEQALINLLPSYASNAAKVLAINATEDGVEWVTRGSGTVTSVDLSVPTGLSVSGNPVTSSGTLAVSFASGYSIPTTTKQGNWDTAYGWGDHAAAGYLDNADIGNTVQAYDSNLTSFVGTFTLPTTDGTNGQLLTTNGSGTLSFTTVSGTGSVTSVDMSVPTGFAITGNPITSAGTLALAFASGYSLPTTTKQGNWDTAYGWGDHAAAGYLDNADIGATVQGYDADTTKNDVSNTFTTNQIISTSSTDPALRITQTGTGNALVVEDSTNPDSTPTIIDASGRIVVGSTASLSSGGVTGSLQQIGSTFGTSAFSSFGFANDATTSPSVFLSKSRGSIGTLGTVVQSGDRLGSINFAGDDGAGTTTISAALIRGEVDGTPGTNDMPGRLIFATTADGASSPTERMRINNAGLVSFGASGTTTGINILANKTLTGGTATYGITSSGQVQSDVTAQANYFRSNPGVVDAAFTLTTLRGFYASQGTIGASATVTNQFGFAADSSLTGATNNYGFYSNIASGTGRWNFYANGTAVNYFAGNVGIGSGKTAPATALDVNGTVTATAFEGTISGGTYA